AHADRPRARAFHPRYPGSGHSGHLDRHFRAVARKPLAPEEIRRAQAPVPENLQPDRDATAAGAGRATRRAPLATPVLTVPRATACNIWTTEGFPANNDGAADEGLRKVDTTLKNGTIFRVIEFAPGLAARNHRTDSIDYIVIISGEIDMELDDSVVHLKAGDVMVQRGTIHNWVNNGTAPCVLAVILIDA